MEKIAVFVNDAPYARRMLQPLLAGRTGPVLFVLVVCPPPLTRHIGRWLSKSARRQWQQRWSVELIAGIDPLSWQGGADQVISVVAEGSLIALARELSRQHSGLRLIDGRRPCLGRTPEPLTRGQAPAQPDGWTVTIALTTGLSAMLALAD